MSTPSRNIFFENLPDYGFITLSESGNMFIWNGHNRGRGRERAVVCWSDQQARHGCQGVLNGRVAQYKRFKDRPAAEFKEKFGVWP